MTTQKIPAVAEEALTLSARPVAGSARVGQPRRKRRLGVLDGHCEIPDDFNRPLPRGVAHLFEGD